MFKIILSIFFFSRSFMGLNRTFESLIHFEFIFYVWCERLAQFDFFACSCPVFPTPFLKRLSFLHCLFLFCWHRLTALVNVSSFSSVHMKYVSTFTLVPYLISVALQYSLKSGGIISSTLFFFLKIVLVIQNLLCFHTNFQIICSSL